jgi:tetratricopeptide (TPR) repeat protein
MALDWSYQLLHERHREVFDHLAVFAGEFDLEAVGAVVGRSHHDVTTVEAIATLSDSSLISVRPAADDTARYRLMETVREYASDRLDARGSRDSARNRHAEYFLGRLEAAADLVMTPEFARRLDWFESYYDEIRQALAWSLEHHSRSATLRAAPALFEFWYRQAKASEAGYWGRLMLAESDDAPEALRAAVHGAIAFGDTVRGNIPGLFEHAEAAIRLCREAGDEWGLVQALFVRAQAALAVGDFVALESDGREGLARCDSLDARWLRSRPLTVLGFGALFGAGDLDGAATYLLEALRLYRELGDRTSEVVLALTPLCIIELGRGNLPAAEGFALDAIAVSDFWEGSALSVLGDVRLAQGDPVAAGAVLRRALERSLDVGLENWFRVNTRRLSVLAAETGRYEDAARLWGASTVSIPAWGDGIGREVVGRIHEQLGDDFDRFVAEGAAWDHASILDAVAASG